MVDLNLCPSLLVPLEFAPHSEQNSDWRQSLQEKTSQAGMIGLAGIAPLLIRPLFGRTILSHLFSRLFAAVGTVSMIGGLVATGGNSILFSDRLVRERSWEGVSHFASSSLGLISIVSGGFTLFRRVMPSPFLCSVSFFSFVADLVEVIANFSENQKEGRPGWEIALQFAMVVGLNLTPANRHEIRRGWRSIVRPESARLQSDDPLQQGVFEVGERLIADARACSSSAREKIVDYAVGLTLRDPRLRSNLLRFTCALPNVADNPKAVVDLAQEFFRPILTRFPAWMHPFLRVGLSDGIAHSFLERFISRVIQMGPEMMSGHFLGGINNEQLAAIIQRLKRHHIDVTVDNLGEFVTSEAGADRYLEKCKTMLGVLEEGSSCSMKLTGLTPQFDPYAPDFVMRPENPLIRRFKELMRICSGKNLVAFVDAEHDETVSLLYRFQMKMLDETPEYKKGGFVVQAYRKDSSQDIDRICAWAKARGDQAGGTDRRNCYVRIVKGAYEEGEVIRAAQRGHPIPVYTAQAETDTNYRRCIDKLLSMHEYVTPCIGGHNVRDIAYAVFRAKQMGILDKIEIQLLFGMSDNLKQALARMGVKVRAYVPHITQRGPDLNGDQREGMAYLGRRLIENGSAASQKNHITWETEPGEVLRLNNTSLETRDLAGLEGWPADYQTHISKDGFQPAAYLNPAEPGRLERFWAEHDRTAGIIATTRSRPITVPECSAEPGLVFHSIDPSTGEVVATIQGMNERDLDQILTKAEVAQTDWQRATPQERKEILLEARREIEARRDYFAALIMHESGKPIAQADADIKECLDAIAYAAADIDTKLREGVFDRYQSRGVAAVVPPWNFPAAIPFIWASKGLGSGSAVVLKPSELAPRIGVELAIPFRNALRRRGYNPNILQLLLTDRAEISKRLVSDPRIKALSFTGSKRVGLQVADLAQGRFVSAEYGGTNGYVAAPDADPDRVVADVGYGAFGYGGQKCSHIQNLFVPRNKLELYKQKLREMAESVVVGSAHNPETLIPPMIHERVRADLDEILTATPAENILVDGRHWATSDNPRQIGPTVVCENGELLEREFFGPMINLIPYDSEEGVMQLIHRSKYGLTFAVATSSPRLRQFYLKRDLETGTGIMAGNLYSEMPPVGAEIGLNPFGAPGCNLSGTGSKTGGTETMMGFLKPKDDLSPKLRAQWARIPTDEEWREVGQMKGNDFRKVQPTELQQPGRTDLWERTPLGQGLIFVDEGMSGEELERLVFGYLKTGNQIDLFYHLSCEPSVITIREKLLRYGLADKLRVEGPLNPGLNPGGLSLFFPIDRPSRLRWVHVREEYEVPDVFFNFFRNPAQSEAQGFVTRINRGTPWIDDDHFLATTQVHRVLSINTALSGDVEKVVI